MAPEVSPPFDAHKAAAEAARWLARRDRGLSPAEQDEYLQWLRAHPQHPVVLARHEAVVARMLQLSQSDAARTSAPDSGPPARRKRRRPPLAVIFAMAASVAFATLIWWRESPVAEPADTPRSHLRVNERQTLPDGSLVELRDGSHIEIDFTDALRRVRLTGGEAHFTVATNPARPFVVEAGGIGVRAVGTAFNVRLDSNNVEVLVTHGRVRLDPPAPAATPSALPENTPSPVADAPELSAGQRAVVSLGDAAARPLISDVSAENLHQSLAWQAPRLQFHETPLREAIDEFNRHAAEAGLPRLVLADRSLGSALIGGTFRIDNVDGFVRLLELTMNLRATPLDDGRIVLSQAPRSTQEN